MNKISILDTRIIEVVTTNTRSRANYCFRIAIITRYSLAVQGTYSGGASISTGCTCLIIPSVTVIEMIHSQALPAHYVRIAVITCITIVLRYSGACSARSPTFLAKIFHTCPRVPWDTATSRSTASPTTSGTIRVTLSIFIWTSRFTFSVNTQPTVLLQAICSTWG